MGRDAILTEDIKQYISELKMSSPRLSAKELIEKVKGHLIETHPKNGKEGWPRERIEQLVTSEEMSESAIVKFNTDLNNKLKILLAVDKPWSTATLDDYCIREEVLPALITAQVNRQAFYSKPLTIRDAKWFSRLYNIRANILGPDAELAKNEGLAEVFITNIIAMWAQTYSRREVIDSLAGIKEPDYSDLDSALVRGDFRAPYYHEEDLLFKKMHELANSESVTKEKLQGFHEKYMAPSLDSQIGVIETRFLNHSLGTLEDDSMVYHRLLTIVGRSDDYFKQLEPVSYRGRLEFFRSLRQISKENGEQLANHSDEDLEEIVANQIKIAKEGEA